MLAHTLLLAGHHGIDLETKIERTWLVWRDTSLRPADVLPTER